MFGFFFGTLCLFGLVGVACSGNRHVTAGYGRRYGRSCGQREGQEDGGRRRRRGRASKAHFARAAGEMFKRRLDIDEDQEDIVDHALKDLRGGQGAKNRGSRHEVGYRRSIRSRGGR